MMFTHLLPRAKAWRVTIAKNLRWFFEGLEASTATVIKLFLDQVFEDIDPQKTRELDLWEAQFGLPNTLTIEQERRDRLDAAWKAHGGQSPRYLQDTLQAAGFDVYIHEWWVPGSEPAVGVLGAATARDPFDYLNDGNIPPSILGVDNSLVMQDHGSGFSNAPIPILSTLQSNTAETLGAPVVELVTNGDFPSATTGWTGINATLSVVSNALRVTSVANGLAAAHQSITTIVGKIYTATVEYKTDASTGSVSIRVGTSANAVDNFQYAFSSVNTYTFKFKATATTTFITLATDGSSLAGEHNDWDNVSITITNDLVAAGGFNDAANNDWTLGANWSIGGGVATHTPGSVAAISQNIGVAQGINYPLTYLVVNRTAGNITPKIGATTGTQQNSNAIFTETIIAGVTTLIAFTPSSVFDGDIDNVSVYPGVPDLSANADALEIHGEIIKTAVAPGAGLVGYGNYSAENFLEQPYSSVFDVGTGAISFHGWVYVTTDAGTQIVFRRGDIANTTAYQMFLANNGDIILGTRASSTNSLVTAVGGVDINTWMFITGTIGSSGTVLKLYKNSVLLQSATVTARDIDTIDPMVLGNSSFSNLPLQGSLSLVKFTDSELTQDQITDIYNYEKLHFQANAGDYPITLAQDGHIESLATGYLLVNKLFEFNPTFIGDGDNDMQDGDTDAAQDGGLEGAGSFNLKQYSIPLDLTKYPFFLYIGGPTFPNHAIVDTSRKNEFETLCMKICPAQQWLGILVDYS